MEGTNYSIKDAIEMITTLSIECSEATPRKTSLALAYLLTNLKKRGLNPPVKDVCSKMRKIPINGSWYHSAMRIAKGVLELYSIGQNFE